METRYCEKCHKTMNEDQFYQSNNLEKYTDGGKLNICKKCLTMHVDNFNPDTYLWILQEIDVPYIPDEWNNLLAKYGKNREKLTGLTILGRYLSKMKLKQFKDYRWKDNEFLQELANSKIEQAMKRQGYEAAEIAQTIQQVTFDMPTEELGIPDFEVSQPASFQESYAQMPVEDDDDGLELTEEDRLYLRLKWGKTYKPDEWVQLEKLYNEMYESYDIQSAGHIDTLKLICKASLKANQLIDIGDIDGFNKVTKTYDSLMKSGKFTAAQNKAQSGEAVDSIGELVAMCEKDGFIPKFYIDEPKDKVDRVLQDMQIYTQNLIMNETNLGNLIDSAMKQIELDKEHEANVDTDDDDALEAELFDNKDTFMRDEDFEALWDMQEELAAEDEAYLLREADF